MAESRRNKVLVAPLGDSPIVVSAMVEALERHPSGPQVHIDLVEVIYPEGHGSQAIGFGCDLIKEALQGRCEVREHPLDFADANTEERCIDYLHTLDEVLEMHANDDVYVSLSGGRKSMAALTAVITQFHPQIRGLYHVLDKHEHDVARRHFRSNEELCATSVEQRRASMLPPVEDLGLVDIPFQPMAKASELRRYLKRRDVAPGAIEIDDQGQAFLEHLFGPPAPTERLEMRVSSIASEQYAKFGSNVAEEFSNCFRSMSQPKLLSSDKHLHGTCTAHGRTYHFYKPGGHTRVRPFFYTEPKDITGWPHSEVTRVVIAALAVHNADYDCGKLAALGPFDAAYTLEDLPHRKAILLAPVGESPMVATQTYALLREREHVDIERVVLIYPGDDPPIRNGVRRVKELFTDRGLDHIRGAATAQVDVVPIGGLQDIDSREACERYGQALAEAIAWLRQRYPEQALHLSLSGGRKAMAALTYFAAQRAGLSRVWHTTISDIELEERVERETAAQTLGDLTPAERAERLFLRAYSTERDKFTLFSVPVIPLA
jgi:hypothetical protein